MIFAQYRYNNYHNDNKEKHPLQPYHWNNWLKMVNDNQEYCRKVNMLKRIELYFYLFTRKIQVVDLPSFHWYWKLQVRKDRKKELKRLIEIYEMCKKDASLIAIYFNKLASLKTIEEKINKKKDELRN